MGKGNTVSIHSLKESLYGSRCKGKGRLNSLVRPRSEFEFFEMDELMEGFSKESESTRSVVMLGGYGQNFVTPYSLMVNYYYVLTFEKDGGRLRSLVKHNVYGNLLFTNVRGPIKNKNAYERRNVLDKFENGIKLSITNPSHYFFHRSIFAFEKGELKSQIKTLYATEQYGSIRKYYENFSRKIGEIRHTDDP